MKLNFWIECTIEILQNKYLNKNCMMVIHDDGDDVKCYRKVKFCGSDWCRWRLKTHIFCLDPDKLNTAVLYWVGGNQFNTCRVTSSLVSGTKKSHGGLYVTSNISFTPFLIFLLTEDKDIFTVKKQKSSSELNYFEWNLFLSEGLPVITLCGSRVNTVVGGLLILTIQLGKRYNIL